MIIVRILGVIFFALLVILSSCGSSPAIIVPPAPQGVQGPTGATGQQGAQGTPGSVIKSVQLCASCTPAYPGEFPEVALCIDNTLYAVYSANGGFLFQLIPGSYGSNGINCSCNFTVGANCEVIGD